MRVNWLYCYWHRNKWISPGECVSIYAEQNANYKQIFSYDRTSNIGIECCNFERCEFKILINSFYFLSYFCLVHRIPYIQWTYQWICTDLDQCAKKTPHLQSEKLQFGRFCSFCHSSNFGMFFFFFIHSVREKNIEFAAGNRNENHIGECVWVNEWKICMDVKQCHGWNLATDTNSP